MRLRAMLGISLLRVALVFEPTASPSGIRFRHMQYQRKYPTRSRALSLVTLIEANWNLICEEILRWVEILKGVQWSLPLPA